MTRNRSARQFFILAALSETDDCIAWPFYVMPNGYGQMYDPAVHRMRLVHVLMCEWVHGPRPEGKEVAHGPCHNRACINSRHLSWKTSRENHLDMVRDGTDRRGEKHPLAKLTAEQVGEIRVRYAAGDVTQQALATEYGVQRPAISRIVTGARW
jgi:hypothetical protein